MRSDAHLCLVNIRVRTMWSNAQTLHNKSDITNDGDWSWHKTIDVTIYQNRMPSMNSPISHYQPTCARRPCHNLTVHVVCELQKLCSIMLFKPLRYDLPQNNMRNHITNMCWRNMACTSQSLDRAHTKTKTHGKKWPLAKRRSRKTSCLRDCRQSKGTIRPFRMIVGHP